MTYLKCDAIGERYSLIVSEEWGKTLENLEEKGNSRHG